MTSGEENLLNKGRTPFVRKLGRGIFFCRWMADNSRQTISRKTLVRLKTEKVTFYRSKGNLHAGGDAPRRATRKPKKIPPAQRAGARRRSPRSGSAAAGAHITRNAGRCAPIAPCGERRTGYTTCDSDVLRHTDKGSTGVVGGVEGLAPLTPCRQPRRLPRPGAGLKPPASGKKNRMHAEKQRKLLSPNQKRIFMPEEMLPAAQHESRKKSHQPSEPGRGGDPRATGAPQQARISSAKREDARRLPPAASGGQGIRHATVTSSAIRTRGVWGS